MFIDCQRTDKYFLFREVGIDSIISSKHQYCSELFLETKENTEYTGFKNGSNLKRFAFSSSKDFSDFRSKFEGRTYGDIGDVYQFLSKTKIDLNMIGLVRPWSIDIEVFSEDEFPSPDKAKKYPVVTVTLFDLTLKDSYTWVYDMFDMCSLKSGDLGDRSQVLVFAREEEMLESIANFWKNSLKNIGVITGWNSRPYDIPYLFNRISETLDDGEAIVSSFSPFRTVKASHKGDGTFQIMGVPHLDYLELFRKFSIKSYPSYKLEDICQQELGHGKLDHSKYKSFAEFYKKDIDTYVKYNAIDASLIGELDEKFQYIRLAASIAAECRVNFEDVYSPVKCWEALIYNELKKDSVYTFPRKRNFKEEYMGAFVLEPKKGLIRDVISFDLTSLYPSVIMAMNISPETIVDSAHVMDVSIDKFLDGHKTKDIYGDGLILDPAGNMFLREHVGVVPKLMKRLFNKRVVSKKEMIKKKKELQALKAQLENEK